MKTWKLTLEYDGSKYSGWQEQANARTVMGELRAAAERVFLAPVEIGGAGRTDAGVHASAQVAHLRVASQRRLGPEQIEKQMNDLLPAEIAITGIEAASNRFHARHDAVSRRYVYQIATRKSAFSKRYVWWVKEPLDVDAMQAAARTLVGRHDFRHFRAPDPLRHDESTIVVVESAELEPEGDLLCFRMEASHFLWRMVRRVTGALVKVGLGELSRKQFDGLLECRPGVRLPVAEWTAPASGLFLESVRYPEE